MQQRGIGHLHFQWTGGLVGNQFPHRLEGDLIGLYRRLGIPPGLEYTRTRTGPAFHDARGPNLQEYVEQLKEDALRPMRWLQGQVELLWNPLREWRLGRALVRVVPSAMLFASLIRPQPAAAGPPEPLGLEFRVNSVVTGSQEMASVAMDADGDFVVVWRGFGTGDSIGIYAQRYNSNGSPVGAQFRVNTYTSGSQAFPSVAMDADGDFVVAWSGYGPGETDEGVFARRYDSSGTAQEATEFLVNTYTTGTQRDPSVAMDSDGDFVIAWEAYSLEDPFTTDVFARRFNAAGGAKDLTEFRVHTHTTGGQEDPSVAMDAGGGFTVAWEGYALSDSWGVSARLYGSDGVPITTDFLVNTYTSMGQMDPSVAADADGDLVIAWWGLGPGDSYGVYVRRYDNTGTAYTVGEVRVNTYTTSDQRNPSVAMDADGDFVIGWSSYGQDGDNYGVFTRRFYGDGSPTSPEFQTNHHWSDRQSSPSVAMDSDGDFVVAWQSYGQDPYAYGVYARRFSHRLSNEFLVNTYTTEYQREPSVAMDADGDFIVAWMSYTQDGSTHGVYAQRFDSTGGFVGSEFLVNSSTTSNAQSSPSVAMDADGDFVIAWNGWGVGDGSDYGIFARVYDVGVGYTDIQINTYTTGQQSQPSVAMDADGDFVVAWHGFGPGDTGSYGIFARRFNSDGSYKDASEFLVNSYTTSIQYFPNVAMDSDGDFIIAWSGYGPGDNNSGAFARRYNSNGVAQDTPEFLVNTYTSYVQRRPSVAMDADGDFVIAWLDQYYEGDGNGVFARRYQSDGTPLGSHFIVNTYTTSHQTEPSVAMDADGDFVIVWQSSGQDGSGYGLFGQRYTSKGSPVGPEFQINALDAGGQYHPVAAMDDEGDFVVAWEAADGDSEGIYARLYDRLQRVFLPLVLRNY